MKLLASYIVLFTGCRHNEAVWILCNFQRGFRVNKNKLLREEYYNKLFAPEGFTKTGVDYTWYLKKDVASRIVQERRKVSEKFAVSCDMVKLSNNTRMRFRTVLTDLGIDKRYTLRSVRRLVATEYVKLCAENRVLGIKINPPNPLQHKNTAFTIRKYAAPNADSNQDAIHRAITKKRPGYQKLLDDFDPEQYEVLPSSEDEDDYDDGKDMDLDSEEKEVEVENMKETK